MPNYFNQSTLQGGKQNKTKNGGLIGLRKIEFEQLNLNNGWNKLT